MEFWIVAGILWLVVGRRMMWRRRYRRLPEFGMRREMRRFHRDRMQELRWRRRHGWTEADDEAWEGRWRGRQSPRLARLQQTDAPKSTRSEDRVAKLQREWIEGRLTDAEYERKLDEVYASTASAEDPARRLTTPVS